MNGPTVQRRRLARRLRQLREHTSMTLEQVAEALGWSTSKLSRIETAQQGVNVGDLRRLLTLYEVDARQAEGLQDLAKISRARGWWNAYAGSISNEYTEYLSLEAEAANLCSYQPQAMPGLFQTEDYARALIRTVEMDLPPDIVEARVRARMARQSLFHREAPVQVWTVVDESALRRPVGPTALMIAQLERLLEVAEFPEVVLQVLPFDAGMHPAIYGPFVILEFGPYGGPSVAYVETLAGDLYIEGEVDLHRYGQVFNHLRAVALSPDLSVATIGRLIQEWRQI